MDYYPVIKGKIWKIAVVRVNEMDDEVFDEYFGYISENRKISVTDLDLPACILGETRGNGLIYMEYIKTRNDIDWCTLTNQDLGVLGLVNTSVCTGSSIPKIYNDYLKEETLFYYIGVDMNRTLLDKKNRMYIISRHDGLRKDIILGMVKDFLIDMIIKVHDRAKIEEKDVNLNSKTLSLEKE